MMSDLAVLSWAKPSGSTGKQDLVKAALIPVTIPPYPISNSHHSSTMPRQALGSASRASNHSSKGDNEGEKWILGQSDTCGLVSKESCGVFLFEE